MRREWVFITVLWSALVGADAIAARAQVPAAPAQPSMQTPTQLQALVAPIALYPDALVAQILAAATYPIQVVEAERWMQQRQDLAADQIAAAADSTPWDPSVKALTQFPAVLAMLDKNLAWSSALGDAYATQPQDVLDAVQVLRRQAVAAGRLKSTGEATVTSDSAITIAPANRDTVYVPVYNPCTIYGGPIVVYPGWDCTLYPTDLVWGIGIPIGWWPSVWGWGWDAWGFDWYHHTLLYHHGAYVSGSNTFWGRVRGRGGLLPAGRGVGRPSPVDRGYGQGRAHVGTRSGAFSGIGPGGGARGASARGRASAGGGARGGGHGGGGRR
jgi:hypothetical protein